MRFYFCSLLFDGIKVLIHDSFTVYVVPGVKLRSPSRSLQRSVAKSVSECVWCCWFSVREGVLVEDTLTLKPVSLINEQSHMYLCALMTIVVVDVWEVIF